MKATNELPPGCLCSLVYGAHDGGTNLRFNTKCPVHKPRPKVRTIPVEQVRSLVRLLYPDEMTPIAKRQFDKLTGDA